ncbi:hypothetical protein BJV78DRAFT_294431 [Lactifluus subvellereus]|nr:hypothetical protein BJV78DRAFT_294431 [Lactifluus subvellereus]
MLTLSTPVIFASSTAGKDGLELRQCRRFTRGIHPSTHTPLYMKVRVTFRVLCLELIYATNCRMVLVYIIIKELFSFCYLSPPRASYYLCTLLNTLDCAGIYALSSHFTGAILAVEFPLLFVTTLLTVVDAPREPTWNTSIFLLHTCEVRH